MSSITTSVLSTEELFTSPLSTTTPTNQNNVTTTDSNLTKCELAFMIVFMVVGFIGNSAVIGTIVHDVNLKQTVLQLFLVSLSIANLLTSLLIGPFILVLPSEGEFICNANSFLLLMVSLVTLGNLAMMSIDRFISIWKTKTYPYLMTTLKANFLIVFCWAEALAFSIAVVIKAVPTTLSEGHVICTIAPTANFTYRILLSLFGFILPLVIILALFSYILKVAVTHQERFSVLSRQPYCDKPGQVAKIWDEMFAAKMTGILFLMWCVLEGPYNLILAMDYYKMTEETENNMKTPLVPSQLYLPFTWLKVSYCCTLPFVVLIWKTWCTKVCTSCLKSNAVNATRPQNLLVGVSKPNLTDQSPEKESPKHHVDNTCSVLVTNQRKVPVLFATQHGLHFQTLCLTGSEEDLKETIQPKTEMIIEKETSVDETTPSTKRVTVLQNNVLSKKCDVLGSGFLKDAAPTSDYDSQYEDDNTSLSNPVSIKSKSSAYSTGCFPSEHVPSKKLERSISSPEKRVEAITTPHFQRMDSNNMSPVDEFIAASWAKQEIVGDHLNNNNLENGSSEVAANVPETNCDDAINKLSLHSSADTKETGTHRKRRKHKKRKKKDNEDNETKEQSEDNQCLQNPAQVPSEQKALFLKDEIQKVRRASTLSTKSPFDQEGNCE